MPAPATTAAAKTISALASAGATGAPPRGGRQRSDGGWLWLLILPIAVVLGLVVTMAMLTGASRELCSPGEQSLPRDLGGPGSLGGVAGTGISRTLVQRVRSISPYAGDHITPGQYTATAYGPPWGGIQGAGIATSGGLPIGGGAPHWYMIATSPGAIAHGTFVYIEPNPFGWKGPFLAADTGGAIDGRRIDFYDWRGRTTQTAWGLRTVKVSARPLAGGRPPGADTKNTTPDAGCESSVVLSSDVGERIGQIARSHLGAGPSIRGFSPENFYDAWCAWFATNVWRKAGVPITISGFSGYPYSWAQSHQLLFKEAAQPPRGPTPPLGSALMYGDSPANTATSAHVNLVDKVLPDGTFMITGGNQDSSRVTRYGPCRLHRATSSYLTGPGCDPRAIYGIAMPAKPSQEDTR